MVEVSSYIEEIVYPTIVEFRTNPTSVRHAFLACVAVFHTVDYIAYPKKCQTLRQQFGQQCPAFAVVDDVAHAFKHVSVGQKRLVARNVIARPPGEWDIAEWDLSRWDDVEGGVTVDTDRAADVLEAIEEAVRFLRSKI